ncbi:MAG: alpha/beta fold hydrolase [Planctomycetales bacterium]|nr:alpha/beta fold hydrolase [Planctomycetales bacterium]
MTSPRRMHFLQRLGYFLVFTLMCATSYAASETPPPAKELSIPTKDGVRLHTTYFPGSEGKKTAVVILVHGDVGPMGTGSSKDCLSLAEFLQREKHAVFVPDLRGYGRSTTQNDDTNAGKRLDSKRSRREDIEAMVKYDMEALKSKIVELHNTGELNANLICVVGFEMGTVVALNWTHLDWSMQSLPNLKQSEDVRAMALISPLQSFRGYAIRDALADRSVREKVSALVTYGKQDDSFAASGRRITKTLERSHAPIPSDEAKQSENQDLFIYELPTSLQGTRLLSVRELKVRDTIRDFVALRVVQQRDRYPWKSRVVN